MMEVFRVDSTRAIAKQTCFSFGYLLIQLSLHQFFNLLQENIIIIKTMISNKIKTKKRLQPK